MDVLGAQQQLATAYVARNAVAIQMLNLDKTTYEEELKYQVALFKLSKGQDGISEAQAAQLKIEYDKKDALERQAVQMDEEAQRLEDCRDGIRAP